MNEWAVLGFLLWYSINASVGAALLYLNIRNDSWFGVFLSSFVMIVPTFGAMFVCAKMIAKGIV